MAVNPFLACVPATSWYEFPYSLSWSNSCEIAEVLSDIPFIAVGILVFGVSILFLVMKRVPPSAVWLFFSALLAFIAAVQDLGQSLANGFAANTISVANESAITAREILFALSIGFRFLFYWSYVTESPRKNLSAASTQRVKGIKFLVVERTQEPHNGSWIRWGLPGKLLGAGLLIAITMITALQIVWRVVHQFHQYNAFYATDTVLELLVSVMFLLKLLSNTVASNSHDNTLVHTFSECLAPAAGLLVNITVGVGNLLSFAFTESTVGRLLQAFEIYVIVVFVVVTALLRHRDILLSPPLSRGETRKDVLFTLPEPVRGSTFRITPPLIETPHMSMILSTATQGKKSSRDARRRSVRRSLNHISSWVSARISRQRSPREDEEVGLWKTQKFMVGPPNTGNTDTTQQTSIESSTQEPTEWSKPVRDAPVDRISVASASARLVDARSIEGSIRGAQKLSPPRMDVAHHAAPHQVSTSTPISTVPLSSKHGGSVTTPPESSPIYGLGGIRSVASPSNSRTSLDKLLRQQSQLDESIQALKLFSRRTSTNSSCSNSVPSRRNVDLSRSSSIGQRTICSEISLSHFPVPPWLATPIPSLPPSSSLTVKRVRGDKRTHLPSAQLISLAQDTHAQAHPKTSVSLVDPPGSPYFHSIPYSPLGEENESLSAEPVEASCVNFEGMQYNVTSFIGGLATPGESGRGSHDTPMWLSDRESSVETIQAGLDVKNSPLRMSRMSLCLDGLPAPPAVAKPLTLAQHSRPSHRDTVDDQTVQYQSNEQRSRALPISHSPHTRVEKGSLLSRETCLTMTTPRVFVRPRPPPLALQSHTGQSLGTHVQLVMDD